MFPMHTKVNEAGNQRHNEMQIIQCAMYSYANPNPIAQKNQPKQQKAILNQYLLKVALAHPVPKGYVVMNFQVLNIWGDTYLVK